MVIWVCGAPAILLGRKLVRRIFRDQPWWGVPAVILGSGPAAKRLIRTLRRERAGLRVVGILTDQVHDWEPELPPILGDLDAAPALAKAGIAQYAIIAMPQRGREEIRRAIQEYCVGFRHVLLVPDLPGLCSLGIAAREIGGDLGLEVPQRLFQPSSQTVKRIVDVAGSALILTVLAPLFFLLALLTKLTSPGPIFFGHSRFGRNGSPFRALKFRTMFQNGDEILARHLKEHPDQLFEWRRDHKLKQDPRVTAIGKWLRRYSIDELPQLWNVLRGDMSLVGPRPIVTAEINKYGSSYALYTRVLPGLTGLWQVSGRNNTTYEERVAFDEYYVRNWSVWLDTYILARTVKTVVTGDGAY